MGAEASNADSRLLSSFLVLVGFFQISCRCECEQIRPFWADHQGKPTSCVTGAAVLSLWMISALVTPSLIVALSILLRFICSSGIFTVLAFVPFLFSHLAC